MKRCTIALPYVVRPTTLPRLLPRIAAAKISAPAAVDGSVSTCSSPSYDVARSACHCFGFDLAAFERGDQAAGEQLVRGGDRFIDANRRRCRAGRRSACARRFLRTVSSAARNCCRACPFRSTGSSRSAMPEIVSSRAVTGWNVAGSTVTSSRCVSPPRRTCSFTGRCWLRALRICQTAMFCVGGRRSSR